MNRRALQRVLVAVFVTGALVWFRHDLAAAFSLVRGQWSPSMAAGIIGVTLLHFVNEPIRWWVLLHAEHPTATLGRLYHLLTAAGLASYLLPARLGTPMRAMVASRALRLDYATTSAVLLIDAVCGYGVWGLAAVAGGAVLLPGATWVIPMALLLMGAGATVIVIAQLPNAHWSGFPRVQRVAAALQLLSVPTALLNVPLLTIDVALFGLRHELILTSLGASAPVLTVTLTAALAVMAGAISLMPMGIGAYDLSMVFLLTSVGVPRDAAVAVPLVNRIVTISIGVILGSLSAACSNRWSTARRSA